MCATKRLIDLIDGLDASSSQAGCESDLMVVGAKEFFALRDFVRQLKKTLQSGVSINPDEAGRLADRLLDSEEHAVESAIPEVAEEGASMLRQLSENLLAAQTELRQSRGFVQEMANLSIWDYDQNNGDPYNECEEPSEGHLDSHCVLMERIESARQIAQNFPLQAPTNVRRPKP